MIKHTKNDRPSYVFNIQHYSLHDGPGIRTIVFLKGCPMRCKWCCNPESQKYEQEISYVQNKCIGKKACGFCFGRCKDGITFPGESEKDQAVIDMKKCGHCLELAKVCPPRAIRLEGESYSAEQLLDIVERDGVFYSHGEGGLTVSGGEPLTHPELLIPLLKGARQRRIHTAVETCGYADYNVLKSAARYLDYILYDIKSMNTEKHISCTGKSNDVILSNFDRLCRDFPELQKKVRTPIIPGFNDSVEEVRRILRFIKDRPNVSYELLPYHSFGRGKYKALGRDYTMGDVKLNQERMNEIKAAAGGFCRQAPEEAYKIPRHLRN